MFVWLGLLFLTRSAMYFSRWDLLDRAIYCHASNVRNAKTRKKTFTRYYRFVRRHEMQNFTARVGQSVDQDYNLVINPARWTAMLCLTKVGGPVSFLLINAECKSSADIGTEYNTECYKMIKCSEASKDQFSKFVHVMFSTVSKIRKMISLSNLTASLALFNVVDLVILW